MVFGSTVALTAPATGFNLLGCRYASDDPEVDIEALVFNGYAGPLADAVSAWNAEAVPGHFDLSPGTSDIELGIVQWSSTESYWATTPGAVECPALNGGDSPTYYGDDVDMYLNDATMASLTLGQRRLVIEHELGHAYGLAHMPRGAPKPKP